MATDKLAKQTDATLAITRQDMLDVKEALTDLGEEEFDLFSLPEITVPAGGGTSWEVPTLEGSDATKTLTGVLLVCQKVRQYYEEEFDGNGVPPDCVAADGKLGIGNPGGECATCHLAQWGAGKNGGQSCKERRHVLLLLEGNSLPYFLNVPTSSIKPLKNYLNMLAGRGIKYHAALTSITLSKVKNATGIEYSQCEFAFAGALSPEQREITAEYRAAMQGLLTARAVQAPTQAPVPVFDVSEYAEAEAEAQVEPSA